ncbi:MAG: chromosomal replication initiator protein DnaA [Armatimonadetes bacterium]|nr:chromosomal replication initiator protein DnaA [Armatimonadota bacterium]
MASALLASKTDLWEAALGVLPEKVGRVTFDSFLRTSVPLSLDGTDFVLGVPSDFARTWIAERHLRTLERCLTELAKEPVSVRLEIVPPELLTPQEPLPAPSAARDVIPARSAFASLPLNPKYTFGNFVVGTCNQFAHAAATQVAKAPGTAYSVLFLHSKVGLGKTHLMQAIGHFVQAYRPDFQVVYISAEQFVNHLINSIRDNRTESFRQHYRSVDIWLVDDIQFIAAIEGQTSEEELFHTFNALYETGKQIVIASDCPPRQLQIMNERLRSRLQQGIVADLRPPDVDTRLAILEKKAQTEGVAISRDILVRLAQQIESNIRVLEGALMKVCAYTSLYGVELTPQTVDEMIRDYATSSSQPHVSIDEIASHVAKHFDVSVEQLKSARRSRAIADARQIAIYLARELTDHSLHSIGKYFGGRDHSTVIHSYRKVTEGLEKDPQMLWLINNMKTALSE